MSADTLKALQEAESALDDAISSLSQLAALCCAIKEASSGHVNRLAELGHYFAEDRGNAADLVREQSIDPVLNRHGVSYR